MRYFAMLVFFVLCFANCAHDLGYHAAIQGKWQAVHWTLANGEARQTENVHFDFHGETYDAQLGQRSEAGKFRIKGDKLYTHAEGQQEIMVGIQKLSAEMLIIEMNRGGQFEVMVLMKE